MPPFYSAIHYLYYIYACTLGCSSMQVHHWQSCGSRTTLNSKSNLLACKDRRGYVVTFH